MEVSEPPRRSPSPDSHDRRRPDAVPVARRPPPKRQKDPTAKLHFPCDFCGKDLTPGVTSRFVVKMEAYAAADPAELTDEDTDADHVEEMARLLTEQEESGDEAPALLPVCKKMRFDLCQFCY